MDQGWGDPSVGGSATLAHGEVGLVGGVLVLYVGLLGRHGRRHSHPGTLRLLGKTPQRLLLLLVQTLQPLRLLSIDAGQTAVGGCVEPQLLAIAASLSAASTSSRGHLGPGGLRCSPPFFPPVSLALFGLLSVLTV